MKRNVFRHLITLGMAYILALTVITTAHAVDGVELSDVVVITAEIVAIDKKDRSVTIRGPEGLATLEFGDKARNFDQVRVG